MAHPTYQMVWTYLKRSVGLRGDALKREFRRAYADKLRRHLDQQGVKDCRFHRWSWQSITLEDVDAGIDSDTPELEGASSRHRAFYMKRKKACKELGKTIAKLVRYVKDNQGRMDCERRKWLADCCLNLFENQSTYLPSRRHNVGGNAKYAIWELMRTQTLWHCFSEFYFFCPSCDGIFSVDDGVEVDGRMYCQDCADRDFERCGDCLTHMAEHAINHIYVDVGESDDDDCRHVCSRCVRNGRNEGRYWLWETGHWHEIEETSEVHADRNAENGTINDYGSAAPVRFDAPAVEIYQPSVDSTQKLADSGFELEWIPKEYGSARNVARRLWRDCWADMGGLERDGSIRSWDGAEIVSHYGPLPRVRDAVKNVAKVLREFNARSHTTPSGCKCGFHVSLSRPADSRVTARLVCFWNNPANREFLKTFTRRWNVSYCKANSAKGDTQRLKNSELYADSLLRNSDRYELINLQNRNRIEIRAFRGSTKTDTLLACLDIAVFGLAYCEMTEDPMYLNADDFCRWMKSLSGEVVPSYALAKLSF